ncbi:unnamed protein product [Alopecurus aequalis]
MEKAARRRHQVPAFGEWNYYYHYDEPEAVMAVAPPAVTYCYAATPEPEACSDVWFRYSPPPRKPATPTKKKTRRPVEGDEASLEKKGRRGRPASEAGCGARATRVVRPVDEDLYQVPPPELASRRRPRRSLWMGCLGCVA